MPEPDADEGQRLLHGLGATAGAAQHRDQPAAVAATGLRRWPQLLWASGVACILGAAFTFAWAASFVKLAKHAQPELSIFEIIFVRSLLSIAASVAAARGRPPLGQLRHAHLLALRGLLGTTAMAFFYAALVRITLAETEVLMFLNPSICAILGWLLLRERFGWLTAIGCLASLVGVVCVAQPPFIMALLGGSSGVQPWGHARVVGVVLGVLSAVFAAGAYITIRLIGKREPSLVVAMSFHTASFFMGGIPLMFGVPQPGVWPNARAWLCLLGVGACSFTAQLLLNRGFQLESAARASSANYSQVIWAALIGLAVFGEPLSALGVLGALLVAAGVVAVAADKQAHQAQAQQQPQQAAGAAGAAGGRLALAQMKAKSSFRLGDEEAAAAGSGQQAYVQLAPLAAERHHAGLRA